MRLPRLKAYLAVLKAVFLGLDPEIRSPLRGLHAFLRRVQLNTTTFVDTQCLICVSDSIVIL